VRDARWTWAVVGLALVVGGGCALGPRSVEDGRLRYNEAVKTTTEQQLLLNIVRLRYTDTPSSLSVSSIAEQREIVAGLKAIPFFTSAAAGNAFGGYRGAVLPQVELSGANRPTLSYTPLDDQEFTRRLFTPITLEGTAYLAKTTWPISTVFRLYLENLNWVSNAETASGPTPRDPPEFADFLTGVQALQRLQDRRLVALFTEEKEERATDGVPAGPNTPTAAVEAAKAGFEYRRGDDGWVVVKKQPRPVLRVGAVPAHDPDFAALCRAFKLDPAKRTFDLTADTLDPFLADAPPAGLTQLDLETRSLLQVLFFVAHGVTVPPCHAASGVAPQTFGADGVGFDWDEVLTGLFKVSWAVGKNPPPCAAVAVRYRDYWFYIDDRDRDTKATFALLVEVSRLELGAKAGAAPILTLPLGGGN
jgi:hypothetical protein